MQFTDNLKTQYPQKAFSEEYETPAFVAHQPDLDAIRQKASAYAGYRNILLIGYGGSNTSLKALYHALQPTKTAQIVNTVDPDELARIRNTFSTADTLVVAISKSGNTVSVIENVLYLADYPMLAITEERDSGLMQLVQYLQAEYVTHPPVGGRFSGHSATTYLPAALAGLDIEGVARGFESAYKTYGENVPLSENPALKLAVALHQLEQQGYTELYIPYYAPELAGLSTLIIQLMHESVCKGKSGQTVYTAYAPEAQHHTNQRLFGGRGNVAALFVHNNEHKHQPSLQVPEGLRSAPFKGGTMAMFDGLPLSRALDFEREGTYQDAVQEGIPAAQLTMPGITAENMGELIGFFQYVAVYSARLRGVNPFDQPHVEESKRITLQRIRDFAGE